MLVPSHAKWVGGHKNGSKRQTHPFVPPVSTPRCKGPQAGTAFLQRYGVVWTHCQSVLISDVLPRWPTKAALLCRFWVADKSKEFG